METSFYDEIDISPNGEILAILSFRWLSFWNVSTGKLIYHTEEYKSVNFAALSFSLDSAQLAIVLNNRDGDKIYFIDVKTKDELWEIPVDSYWKIVFSPDWRCFALGVGLEGEIEIWDIEKRVRIMQSPGLYQIGKDHNSIDRLVFSHDGSVLASMSKGVIRFWDVASGKLIAELEPDFPVQDLAFCPNGHCLAMTGYDGVIRIWGIP